MSSLAASTGGRATLVGSVASHQAVFITTLKRLRPQDREALSFIIALIAAVAEGQHAMQCDVDMHCNDDAIPQER